MNFFFFLQYNTKIINNMECKCRICPYSMSKNYMYEFTYINETMNQINK